MSKLVFVTPHAAAPYRKRLEEIWESAPAAVRQRDLSVRFVTREQINARYGKRTTYRGYFENGVAHILWRMGEALTVELFCHEASHFVDAVLGLSVRWSPFYAKNVNLMPTPYAKGNSVEGFAECYSRILEPAIGPLHPTVKAWLDANVGAGGPVTPQKRVCPTCKGAGTIPA